jgi:hypothetical protein
VSKSKNLQIKHKPIKSVGNGEPNIFIPPSPAVVSIFKNKATG